MHDGTFQDGASTRAICVEKHGQEHPPSPHHEFVTVLGVGPALLKSSFFHIQCQTCFCKRSSQLIQQKARLVQCCTGQVRSGQVRSAYTPRWQPCVRAQATLYNYTSVDPKQFRVSKFRMKPMILIAECFCSKCGHTNQHPPPT